MAEGPPDSEPHRESLPDLLADARRVARRVLAEDGPTDITSELVGAAGQAAVGTVRSGEEVTVAGLHYAAAVAREVACEPEWTVCDGDIVGAGESLGVIRGDLGAILRAERPVLNLLQRACGIATETRRFVEAVAGTGCRVLHTRKTAPGLRAFDVQAVLAGGGQLHRLGLERVVLIKDNHWPVLAQRTGGLASVCDDARRRGVAAIYVEVEFEAQVESACHAGVDRLLIDNQPPEAFRRLADLARRLSPQIEVEATGGITLDNVPAYAESGADFVSIGALTHSVRAVDLALEL